MSSASSVVIMGAGGAGGQAILALRRLGYEGTIDLIGAEALAPYERPPLSKEILTQEHAEPTWIIEPAMLSQLGVKCRLDSPVEKFDPQRRRARLADGEELPFDRLLIATGSTPRLLAVPGAELEGVLYLRSFRDAQAVCAAIARRGPLAIIGGGFIGLEVAAAARVRQCAVTVIEAGPQLMGRVVPAAIAGIFAAEHRRWGVTIEVGRRPVRFHGTRTLEAIELDDGRILPASTVVVGIGVSPHISPAAQLGMATDDGIVVDMACRTSISDVYAAGDCCRMGAAGVRGTRVEAWQSALDQGDRAAHAMLGIEQPSPPCPWMWSTQYDYQIQAAGSPSKVDQVVIRGEVAAANLVCFQLWKGHLVGAIGVNRSRDMAWVRRALTSTPGVDPGKLADERWSLRQLLPQRTAVWTP